MKVLYASIILLALALLGLSFFAGLSYYSEGRGLHPVLSGLLGGLAVGAGWWAAGKLGFD